MWAPLRRAEWQSGAAATFYEFRTSGTFPWRPTDPTATQRKATERRLAHLADVGLVALSGRERRTQPRLTDAGDRHARALANLPGVDAGLSSVREVARLGGRVSDSFHYLPAKGHNVTQRQFGIGDHVTFRDRGVTREGRVVATEDVGRGDLRGRSAGRWFTLAIRGELFASAEVPENALGSILELTA